MSYIGKWHFHSIGIRDENMDLIYVKSEEFISSPMPYVDESDEEAIADEIKQRKQIVNSYMEINPDGKLYLLMPVPEGVSDEELNESVKAGYVHLRDGMLCDNAMEWEERDGKLWINSGIEGEAFGEATDPWICASDDDGLISFITTRYEKEA